ncbi:MAG: 30S ribosomal protein S13 [Thermoprotei archaeon]
MSESQPITPIVRLANKDLNGLHKTFFALHKIKGIGINTAYAICRIANVNPEAPLGSLSPKDLKTLESLVLNLTSGGVPWWFTNRPRDPETGKHYHLIGSDLVLKVKEDIDKEKELKTWRGIRHAYGLKVRGQRTRTTGRTGVTVGVTKKPKE